MRELKVVKSGEYNLLQNKEGRSIVCPIQTTIEGDCSCYDLCAWFHLKETEEYVGDTGFKMHTFSIAMCKDHIIGKIVSEFKENEP
jgi:hypothetical protein